MQEVPPPLSVRLPAEEGGLTVRECVGGAKSLQGRTCGHSFNLTNNALLSCLNFCSRNDDVPDCKKLFTFVWTVGMNVAVVPSLLQNRSTCKMKCFHELFLNLCHVLISPTHQIVFNCKVSGRLNRLCNPIKLH